MKPANHTPLPWSLSKADTGQTAIVGPSEANAALIVRAVNRDHAFEALIELAEMVSRSACLQQFNSNECICFSCKAKAALKQAEPFTTYLGVKI